MDYFIIDLYEKKIYCYKDCDSFGYEFRTNKIYKFDIDKLNRIKELYNKKIVKMPMDYLYWAKYLEVIDLPNLERMSWYCFSYVEA